MKKSLIMLGGWLAMAFTACTNEEIIPAGQENPAGKEIIVKAYTAGDDAPNSRVTSDYDEDNKIYKLTWSDDDQFSVIRGKENQTFTKVNTDEYEDIGENEFIGLIPTDGAGSFYAIYPVTEATNSTKATFDISNQNTSPYLMYAISSDGTTYQFQHALAYLKVQFPDDFADKTATITITTPTGVYTNGNIDLTTGTLSGNSESGNKNTITQQVTFGNSPEAWFALPPMAANNKALNFKVVTTDGNYNATLNGTANKNIEAGSYYVATINSMESEAVCQLPTGAEFYNSFTSTHRMNASSVKFEVNKNYTGGTRIGNTTAYYKYNSGSIIVYTSADKFVFNEDCSTMFKGFSYASYIDFGDNIIDTENVTNMSKMFNSCAYLTELRGNGFNTANVTDMSYMFESCSKLSQFDLSSINTAKVTNMSFMFARCTSLPDLSSLNTSNVTNMSNMFFNCNTITSLDLSNFNTAKVADMRQMFRWCYKLATLNLISFNFDAITNNDGFKDMFIELGNSLETKATILLKDEATVNKVKVKSIGYGKYNLKVLDSELPTGLEFNAAVDELLKVNTNLTKIKFIARSAATGTQIGESGAYMVVSSTDNTLLEIHTAAPTFEFNADCSYMFAGLKNIGTETNFNLVKTNFERITSIDFNGCINTKNVTNMYSMFNYCQALSSIDVSGFNTENVTTMRNMFTCCKALTALDLSSFNTVNVENMRSMFDMNRSQNSLGQSSLQSIIFGENFTTAKVADMRCMFRYCTNLQSLDLLSFAFKDGVLVSEIFNYLTSISISVTPEAYNYLQSSSIGSGSYTLIVPPLPEGKVFNTAVRGFLAQNTGLTKIKFIADENWDPTGKRIPQCGAYMVANTAENTLEIRTVATSFVFNANCRQMFRDMADITSIVFNDCIDTGNVTDMWHMFSGCRSLISIDLSDFNTNKVTNMIAMFSDCKALTELDLSSFNTTNVTRMDLMFDMVVNQNTQSPSSLKNIIFGEHFTTGNVTGMSYMFRDCYSLESLDLSKFVFNNAPEVREMFREIGKEVSSKPIGIKVTADAKSYLESKTGLNATGINAGYAQYVIGNN